MLKCSWWGEKGGRGGEAGIRKRGRRNPPQFTHKRSEKTVISDFSTEI